MIRLALLVFAALLVFSGSAEAAVNRTCASGTTVYEKDGVRVFEAGRSDDSWFACGPTSTRPSLLWTVSPAYGHFAVTARIGDKLVFEGDGWGEGGGENTFVGWFDARTSEVRRGELAGGVSNTPYEVTVAADGSLGLVVGFDEEASLRVGHLKLSSTPGALQRELVLATPGARVPGSLAFADGDRALTWRLQDGTTRSVPTSGEAVTCTSGTTIAEAGGARVFEVFPNRKTDRGFQADVLAACARGATKPRELGVSDVYDQQLWGALALSRAGDWTAFATGLSGLVVLDGTTGQVRFVEPRGVSFLQDVAISAAGEVVFIARESWTGGTGSFVFRVTDRASERLATPGGETVPGSLAVTGDGRATWQIKDGLAQSTPLAGEAAVTCGAGTALIDRDGLRVFELMLKGGKHTRLYVCPPGAATPVLLRTGPRRAGWEVAEFGRERGRVALYLGAETHFDDDYLVSISAAGVRAASLGQTYSWGYIRGVAVAPDGRIGVAHRRGSRWRVTLFDRGRPGRLKRERTLARPRDGVRPGTLAFSGRRLVWRSRAGASRGVRVQ
ncbi:hypothetical protein OJ997_07215 [Solirubrobacter phytolaccae]|uniref:Uncharacterized protein n=1 Tax=Solirubrobacter phytolaccae TaxID=1404360 RepID=A0A9X3SA93_9ACTN|nr:hypothetical protein [Solirubrobacter phytolaccae]MDA0180080.1 hypothetical protein [Solirubrobacter phytolaccae]